MIETSNHRTSSVRRFRRKLPGLSFLRNLELKKGSTLLISACTIMAGFILLAFLSPMFKVRDFRVIQKSPFVEVPRSLEVLEEFKGQNMIFLHRGDIRSALRKSMPELREIEIKEDWPRSLEIIIDTAKPKYNLFNTETTNFSAITEDGVVLIEETIEGLPVIKIHQHPDFIKKRQQILSPSQLVKIHEAEGIIDADLMLPVTSVEVYLAANELHFVSRGGMKIWLDLSRAIKPQLDKLVAAERKIRLYQSSFDHIDLRIPQQIFWQEN